MQVQTVARRADRETPPSYKRCWTGPQEAEPLSARTIAAAYAAMEAERRQAECDAGLPTGWLSRGEV